MTALRLMILGTVLVAISPARAEDFTGFYAGVNVGYAFDRERHEQTAPNVSSDTPLVGGDAGGLPPSALTASQSPAMRGSRTERPPQR